MEGEGERTWGEQRGGNEEKRGRNGKKGEITPATISSCVLLPVLHLFRPVVFLSTVQCVSSSHSAPTILLAKLAKCACIPGCVVTCVLDYK